MYEVRPLTSEIGVYFKEAEIYPHELRKVIWYYNTDYKFKQYVSLKTNDIDNMNDLVINDLRLEPQNYRSEARSNIF
jgi:hypothetical protein